MESTSWKEILLVQYDLSYQLMIVVGIYLTFAVVFFDLIHVITNMKEIYVSSSKSKFVVVLHHFIKAQTYTYLNYE